MRKMVFAALVLSAGALPANALQGLSPIGDGATTSPFNDTLIHKTTSVPYPNWQPGARVSCNWKGRGTMYRGKIARRLPSSRIRVHYDDGDRETTFISNCRLLGAAPPPPRTGGGGWRVGARVSCNWKNAGRMYTGTIARRFGPTSIRVHYDDGDRETTSTFKCRLLARGSGGRTPIGSQSGWRVGARVSCNWLGRGQWFSGVIAARRGSTGLRIHYDDGDRETTSIGRCQLR